MLSQQCCYDAVRVMSFSPVLPGNSCYCLKNKGWGFLAIESAEQQFLSTGDFKMAQQYKSSQAAQHDLQFPLDNHNSPKVQTPPFVATQKLMIRTSGNANHQSTLDFAQVPDLVGYFRHILFSELSLSLLNNHLTFATCLFYPGRPLLSCCLCQVDKQQPQSGPPDYLAGENVSRVSLICYLMDLCLIHTSLAYARLRSRFQHKVL